MLYVTTRSNCETYTAAKTLTVDTATDGGLFVPFQLPAISVAELQGMSHGEIIAKVLGLFFRVNLTEDDITQCIGSSNFKLETPDRKVTVAQLWNTANRSFRQVEYAIYRKLCRDVPPCEKITQWPKIAIRIAVLAALVSNEKEIVDIALNAGDFIDPISAWYCRQMGLPIGRILCITNENGALWDLFTHGQASCGTSVRKTVLPELDVALPLQLERLIFSLYGLPQAIKFAACAEKGSTYKVSAVDQFAKGFSVCVVSTQRVSSVIHKVYSTNRYILDTYAALTFGGLQDYRATSGEIRQTLLLSNYSPVIHEKAVAEALHIPAFKINELL